MRLAIPARNQAPQQQIAIRQLHIQYEPSRNLCPGSRQDKCVRQYRTHSGSTYVRDVKDMLSFAGAATGGKSTAPETAQKQGVEKPTAEPQSATREVVTGLEITPFGNVVTELENRK